MANCTRPLEVHCPRPLFPPDLGIQRDKQTFNGLTHDDVSRPLYYTTPPGCKRNPGDPFSSDRENALRTYPGLGRYGNSVELEGRLASYQLKILPLYFINTWYTSNAFKLNN